MKSKKGRPELVSLLQYMKNTRLDNPDILIKDSRIVELDEIVSEVKQSEEWEEISMNILEIGIQQGIEKGIKKGIEQGIEQGKRDVLKQIIRNMMEREMSDDDIIKLSGCTQEILEEMKKERK